MKKNGFVSRIFNIPVIISEEVPENEILIADKKGNAAKIVFDDFTIWAGIQIHNSSDRRLVKVQVANEYIIEMMRRSFVITRKGTRVIKGIPSDAEFIGCFPDPNNDYSCFFVFRHPDFEVVPQGEEPPYFDIVMGAINEFESPALRFLDFLTSWLIRIGVK